MGDYHHRSILVAGSHEDVVKARAIVNVLGRGLTGKLRRRVRPGERKHVDGLGTDVFIEYEVATPVTSYAYNNFASFLIVASGGKLGGEHNDAVRAFHETVKQALYEEDLWIEWIEIVHGETDPQITATNLNYAENLEAEMDPY